MNSYAIVGDALYNFVRTIDITSVYLDGWGNTFNRPFEPDEVTNGGYPCLMVVPAEDEASGLDTATDADRIVYWVQVSESVQTTLHNGETDIRAVADLVRNAIRNERGAAQPFGIDAYDVNLTGQWGWDTERGERFYRCIVSVNIAQDITT